MAAAKRIDAGVTEKTSMKAISTGRTRPIRNIRKKKITGRIRQISPIREIKMPGKGIDNTEAESGSGAE